MDTSVTMTWCFDDEVRNTTDALLESLVETYAVVPKLWDYEVSNVLIIANRKGRISESNIIRFLKLLEDLPIVVDDVTVNRARLFEIGRYHSLTAYDASYIELSQRLGLGFATLNLSLRQACKSSGVNVLEI